MNVILWVFLTLISGILNNPFSLGQEKNRYCNLGIVKMTSQMSDAHHGKLSINNRHFQNYYQSDGISLIDFNAIQVLSSRRANK